jgi:abequosyltransferase
MSTSDLRQPGQPLLSLTIPTFNRAPFLAELLEALLPQFAGLEADAAELVISDNASTDNTAEMIASFQARGLAIRYHLQPENIGADGNFLTCLEIARGQYCWVMGDDDLPLPNAIPALISLLEQGNAKGSDAYDMVYLSSVAFSGSLDPNAPVTDKLGRFAEVVTEGRYFLEKVNALLGLISVVIINRNRLLATPHPPLSDLKESNLLQMGWIFPLIHRRMRVLFCWQRLIAYRSYNSGGWGICEVFGVRLERIARTYFAADPPLARALMNGVLRYWLCDAILEMRRGRHAEMNAENFAHDIRHVFSRNWRYWIFVYPVAELPLPVAEALHRLLNLANKLTRAAQALRRHVFGHGRYLQP